MAPQSETQTMQKEEGHADRILSESLEAIISIYYNDTTNSVSYKVGKFLSFDSFNLMILEQGNDNATIIPRRKCIRIELGGKQ